MVLWVECEDIKYGSVVLLHFVGCLPALTTELGYPMSQRKNEIDGAEALCVGKLGRWYSVFHLLLTRR